MGHKKPEVAAKRRKMVGKFFKWIYNSFINKHMTPTCNCGWNMKHYKDSMFITEYICMWKKCGWGTFQTANGKLHWWKKSENNA